MRFETGSGTASEEGQWARRWCGLLAGCLLWTCVAGQAQAPVVRRPATTSGAGPQAPSGLGSSDGASTETVQSRDGVPTIRVQSRLVPVIVNVTDPHGMPLGGLEQGDFSVLEDGRPQRLAVFERESSTPLSVVLAVDTSETVLRDERVEREAAKQFVRALLRSRDELGLMDFADVVREVVPFTNDRRLIEAGLGELHRGAETALYDAIYLGSERLGQTKTDAGRRRVLVVISDGGDTKNKVTYGQAVEQALRAGVMVFALIVVPIEADAGRNTGGEHALIQMAEDTGGRYYRVSDPKELQRAFAKISDDLRTQYVLGYYAPAGEAGFRRIRVKLRPGAGDDDVLHYRSGYYAAGRP